MDWERPANALLKLQSLSPSSFATLCADLEIDAETLAGEDPAARSRTLVRLFTDRQELDALEDAINRVHAVRLLKHSLGSGPARTIAIFVSYSHKDEKLRKELDDDLKALEEIAAWYDGKILPGDEIDQAISQNLDQAHIILLLVSRKFLASKYIREIELPRAMARHDSGEAQVIPIILKPSQWKERPWADSFSRLKVLPTDGKPVVKWNPRDDGFLDVYRGIVEVLDRLTADADQSAP